MQTESTTSCYPPNGTSNITQLLFPMHSVDVHRSILRTYLPMIMTHVVFAPSVNRRNHGLTPWVMLGQGGGDNLSQREVYIPGKRTNTSNLACPASGNKNNNNNKTAVANLESGDSIDAVGHPVNRIDNDSPGVSGQVRLYPRYASVSLGPHMS